MLIGAIQSGGKSSRMGEDKAWLKIDQVWMIERVIEAAAPLVDCLCVCAGAGDEDQRYDQLSESWNASVLRDIEPDRGPLGGILAALKQFHDGGNQIFVLACDLPFLRTSFLELIRDVHYADGAQITVPMDETGRPQPLASIYDGSCLALAQEHFDQQRLRVDLLFDRVSTRRIGYDEYRHLSGAKWFLSNVNSPQDLEIARNHLRESDA